MNLVNYLSGKRRVLSNQYFIRVIDFESIFESFFVSAIIAILGIRIFLQLTNYPKLGGGGFHIAHMLWGGMFMLFAIIILLIFLGRPTRRTAAILGGLGFGAFIDELGKFITSDNNYFFQPTFSLIYLIFVILYVTFYSFRKYWDFSKKEYLINSLEYIKEAIMTDLNKEEKRLAMHYLSHSDQNNQITITLKDLYKKLDTIPESEPNIITRIKKFLTDFYLNLVQKKLFKIGVNVFFIVKFILSILLVISSLSALIQVFILQGITIKEIYGSTIEILDLFASSVAGVFIIIGVIKMRRSRLEAYKMFKKSVYISIFLVQVFSFYQEQLSAFLGLIFNILILIALNSMIDQERAILHKNQEED
ncbi:MAG: hypothetical protein M1268_01455 [Patescibacteria group bacterium]|nr:hypothetical protein [Patescibacteria group bacterium]